MKRVKPETASAKRVLRRYVVAGFENAINGTYYTLRWNKVKWQIEESDEPISGFKSMTEESQLPTYEMPTLFKQLEWYTDSYGKQMQVLNMSPSVVLAHASLKEDRGPEARAKLVGAYDRIADAALSEMKADGQTERARALENVLKKFRGKLKWKKIQ